MKKRFLAMFLALVMCLALLPTAALAVEEFTIKNGLLSKYNGPGGAVTIPNGVTSIGHRAFYNCKDVTSVTIPNSVTSIEASAFQNCTKLTSIVIPGSVTSFAGSAFVSCTGLTAIEVDPGNQTYAAVGGVMFTKDMKTLVAYPGGKKGTYTIPNSVTSIGDHAFIGTELAGVTIPDGVTKIGKYAFSGCKKLTSVTIPNSVTSIGDDAFQFCLGLMAIEVDSGNQTYTAVDGVVFTKDMKTLVAYPGGKKGTYTVPNSVTSIGLGAFNQCDNLTGVTIPNSVTSIKSGAFVFCGALASVTISSSVTSIERSAFLGCEGLKDVYYGGTEAQWNAIKIEDDNEPLTNAAKHYNSTMPDQPTTPDKPTLPTVEAIPASGTAYTSDLNVNLDGKTVTFSCYALKNEQGYLTNYIRLRDLAVALNGTKAQFNAEWDAEKGIIKIVPNTAFDSKDGEGKVPFSGDQAYTSLSDKPISFNGESVKLTSINIQNGNTYYKVADLGKLLNFNVKWVNGVVIETDKPYTGK